MTENLYVHFPFCRKRCAYCSLYSQVGVADEVRGEYVAALVRSMANSSELARPLKTIYFGGGSPALCDLSPLGPALASFCDSSTEFTVELHPLDVSEAKLKELKTLGASRISMGVQSLDDEVLAVMGRNYRFEDAERAFALIKQVFDNAGIDLIVGLPGETVALTPRHARLAKWGLKHCSVYSLQNERGLKNVVDDDTTMDRIAIIAKFLNEIGLKRYEISNYAVPGFECRHNQAVWRGEDYFGLGAGAAGRIGRFRTLNSWGQTPLKTHLTGVCAIKGMKLPPPRIEEVSPEEDFKERFIFRLRTYEGIDLSAIPTDCDRKRWGKRWGQTLQKACKRGLVARKGSVYRLTGRGTEVCDSILLELV